MYKVYRLLVNADKADLLATFQNISWAQEFVTLRKADYSSTVKLLVTDTAGDVTVVSGTRV